MIDTDELRDLIKTYERYGWQFRRLAAKDTRSANGYGSVGVPISVGVTDAAWFSRPPGDGPVAWEIRYLGGTQYALVEHLDENSPDFEDQLHQMEERLASAVAAK
ncbi:MAG TPA: hypothetical protein VL501_04335 [Pyrinomonadaceae bacterium]|nr:hypothetical protein [Pyrinomonadaceae bacterium]